MEKHYFNPAPQSRQDIQLFTLEQSRLQHFDALVIAAANEHHLPGDLGGLPFFNESVRAGLGLPDWRLRLRARERQFRLLLESSQSVLVTWQQSNNGEPVSPCAWLAALIHFHKAAYGSDLQDYALLTAVNGSESSAGVADDSVPPYPPRQPAPVAPVEQLPTEITVSAHQRLINCPYQFFVGDILLLKPTDEIRETLQKSDYGNRVHACLEAFHSGVVGLPGPFQGPLTAANREDALEQLEVISRQVFTRDIEDNFQHRGWLRRWLAFIPRYIDWQIGHNRTWRIEAAEQRLSAALSNDLVLRGRIDRVEKNDGKTGLIDYKTGKVPKQAEVLSGEEVQLVSYSLLLEHVSQVLYLGLDDREGINDGTCLEAEALVPLRESVRERLIQAFQCLRDGTALPAFADKATCQYCDAAGVCRRQVWERVK
jgi:ATP-dependent helicase/nuclease subunit B